MISSICNNIFEKSINDYHITDVACRHPPNLRLSGEIPSIRLIHQSWLSLHIHLRHPNGCDRRILLFLCFARSIYRKSRRAFPNYHHKTQRCLNFRLQYCSVVDGDFCWEFGDLDGNHEL